MSLVAIIGQRKPLNRALLFFAARNSHSLVVDASYAANPHALFPHIQAEELQGTLIVPAESLYRFRDVLRCVPIWVKQKQLKHVVITTFTRLFDYGDEAENQDIFIHAWEIMRAMDLDCTITVGVESGSHQEIMAYNYAGRIIPLSRWEFGENSIKSAHSN